MDDHAKQMLLEAAGVGCGSHCICRERLARTLTHEQLQIFMVMAITNATNGAMESSGGGIAVMALDLDDLPSLKRALEEGLFGRGGFGGKPDDGDEGMENEPLSQAFSEDTRIRQATANKPQRRKRTEVN